MRKVSILIPASPVRAFFSQVAAFQVALRRIIWRQWEPSLMVCMGGKLDADALRDWRPYLRDVAILFVPDSLSENDPFFYAQIDGLFRWAPNDVDVLVRMDADTLPVGGFEDVLDHVVETASIAGVMAHFAFPTAEGMTSREAWLRAADGLTSAPLDFRQAYSLTGADVSEENRLAPFYINDGAMFIPRALFRDFAERYLSLRPKLMARLVEPYYSGQVALSLAAADMGARTCALPMRYNFPNDPAAEARFPEELENVKIFHYLRTNEFDRQQIFDNESNYHNFLHLSLRGVNKIFQQHVLRIIGPDFPFGISPPNRSLSISSTHNTARTHSPDPCSREAYEIALAAHMREVASPLARLDAAIEPADLANVRREPLDQVATQRVLLVSGLFDANYYLQNNPDVQQAGVDPLVHYVSHGDREGRSPNPFFHPLFYRRRSMTGLPNERNALRHYIEEGERAGQKASMRFDPREYLAANPAFASFVDRPLFHFLKIGLSSGFGPTRALTAVLPALEYAERFEASGAQVLELLMNAKQALISTLGVELGFSVYKEVLTLPDSDQLKIKRLESQYAFARDRAEVFAETNPGGKRFTIEAPVVIGRGDRRPLEHVARTSYVACLANACVRGRSAVIEIDNSALLDYEKWEFDLFDCELDIDPAIFYAAKQCVWMVAPKEESSSIDVDEAFMLLGPQTGAFGDWMGQSLPRYIAADMSGAMPVVPVLMDAGLPQTIRQSLELMLRPGAEIIEIPSYTRVRARRLWCGPSLHYAPAREKMDRRFRFDYISADPSALLPVVREFSRRADLSIPQSAGPERVFLARRLFHWRKLVNHSAIEAAARARGFSIVFPEDLTFAAQVALLRNARFVVAPEGSALFLAYFARAGLKLCILSHPLIEGTIGYNGTFDRVEITILTGPVVRSAPHFAHRADYEIDEKAFCEFLDQWLCE